MKFKQKIFLYERSNNRTRAHRQVVDTFEVLMIERFRELVENPGNEAGIIEEMNKIREFCEKSMKKEMKYWGASQIRFINEGVFPRYEYFSCGFNDAKSDYD